MKHNYLFIVGGVMSGVGKGTSSAALGLTLKAKGYNVTAIKIDPYVNVDAGTMNPVEHGEVFVTVDGDETDQDVGTYERYLETNIPKINYMTTGRVYQTVIQRERNLEYKGKCVEVVPHVPEEIIRRIEQASEEAKADITLIEVGGTVGEYQNVLFLEAARMMQVKNPKSVRFVIVSYLPVPPSVGEMKSKPTQYAIRTLNSAGIRPDFVIGRSTMAMDDPRKQKIAWICGVPKEHIISAPDAKSVYDIPDMFEDQDFADNVLKCFKLKRKGNDLKRWHAFVKKMKSSKREIKIGVVGKYFSTGDFVLSDVYISVLEAIKHAAVDQGVKAKIEWLNSEEFEKNSTKMKKILSQMDGVIVPGGFGSRGIEGKIAAIEYCRKNKVPYLGLCYGLQCAVIEFARHKLGYKDANTTEIDEKTKHPVVHIQESQKENVAKGSYGGTLRLGGYPCMLKKGTTAQKAYGGEMISERHRHRYEVNNEYRDELEKAGLVISGISPDDHFVEIVEIKDHPFFVGTQFHPEFQSRPLTPHPLCVGLMKAAKQRDGGRGK
ncbi:MAG: CTP synthetase [Candidatus Uhrbacteria bacterium GW2011_GWB1_41_7]|nr:MAG: CTP synthetase [Candidatus Uhrbacteria bacterium GW2011_GWB1_41_7]